MGRGAARVVALAAAGALALAGTGAAADNKLRVLARKSASGPRALVKVDAVAQRPETLRVRVHAQPRQRISGKYELTCQAAASIGTERGGFAGRAPVTRPLRFPPNRMPLRCFVKAEARLAGSGQITVLLLKTP